MPEVRVEYLVRPDRSSEVVSVEPLDIREVDVWTVTRVSSGSMGWHIGKYKDESTAKAVAAMLQGVADAGKEVLS